MTDTPRVHLAAVPGPALYVPSAEAKTTLAWAAELRADADTLSDSVRRLDIEAGLPHGNWEDELIDAAETVHTIAKRLRGMVEVSAKRRAAERMALPFTTDDDEDSADDDVTAA